MVPVRYRRVAAALLASLVLLGASAVPALANTCAKADRSPRSTGDLIVVSVSPPPGHLTLEVHREADGRFTHTFEFGIPLPPEPPPC